MVKAPDKEVVMRQFDDLCVLARDANEFASVASADFMIVRLDERSRALGWITVTENSEFDARSWTELPVGVFLDLEQAVHAVGKFDES
jgi:hypothetical protein